MFSTNKRLNVFNMLYLTILRKCPESCVLIKTVWERPSQSPVLNCYFELRNSWHTPLCGSWNIFEKFSSNKSFEVFLSTFFYACNYQDTLVSLMLALPVVSLRLWAPRNMTHIIFDQCCHGRYCIMHPMFRIVTPLRRPISIKCPPPLNIIFLLHF